MVRKVFRSLFNKLKSARVIMLHHVSQPDDAFSPCIISTENFKSFLDANKKYLSFEELINTSSLKYNGACVITIDDGLEDLYTVAYLILTERNIPFTAFVSSELLGSEGYITEEQLKEMSKNPLVTIGSHGATHRCLDELTYEEQRSEIFDSKSKLEAIIGKKIDYFAYSNGRFTKETRKLVKSAGYRRAVGVRPRAYNIISSLYHYEIPRFNLTNGTIKNEL